MGDAFCTVFPTVLSAITAALDAQRVLAAEPWGEIGPIRVRMAIHAGNAEERDNDYFGPAVNRVARLLSAGHGGQVLLSAVATELVQDHLPEGTLLRNLGEHHLKDLTRPEHIVQLVGAGLQADFPPIVTQDRHPHNLPPQLTTVIGREREVKEIREKLGQEGIRLVTITGPGGVGKTRLSLQVGSEMLEAYADGVWFVPLDEATDEAAIQTELATVFGVREVAEHTLINSLNEYLRDKHLLIILDNFEQVAHAAPLVSRLLRVAPRIQALITSRTRLGLQGEHELPVPPLEVPDRRAHPTVEELRQCSAVSLFVDRASAARSGFALTEDNAHAITEICRGLDSLPLAIELAAARVKLLTPEALLARMEQRLGLLTGGRGDRPQRHQTLRATILWSFDLLTPEEQILFTRLAVFAGGFTIEAAESVCNPDGRLDILVDLESLVDHSLIRQSEDASGEPRFTMLATIRAYALEQLEALPDDPAYQQHFAWCLRLTDEAEWALQGPAQQAWLDRLEDEHDNLRAALAWTWAAGRRADTLRLAGTACRFWEMRGHLSEGRKWLAAALAPPEDVPADVLAKALHGLGNLMVHQGDHADAAAVHERSLDLYRGNGDRRGAAGALTGLACTRLRQGELETAARLYGESLSLFEEANDDWGTATAINGLATVAHEQLKNERAQSLYEQGLTAFQTLGDQHNIALSLNNLATIAHDRKDYERASALYDRAAALTHVLGDRRTMAMTLNNQGIVAHDQGEYQRAEGLYEQSLALFQELGDRRGVAYLLLGLGIVADDQRDYHRAITRLEESMALFRAIADQRGVASAHVTMASASHHLGDTARAMHLYAQALAYWLEHDDQEGTVECLNGIAIVVAAQGDFGQAVRLLASGASMHETDAISLTPAGQAEYQHVLAEARAALGEDAFSTAWEAGRSLPLNAAAAEALRASAAYAVST